MPDQKVKTPRQWLFRAATFPGSGGGPPTTAANFLALGGTAVGAGFQVLCNLSNLSGSTGARESNKFDLGANWGRRLRVDACLQFASAPTDGTRFTFMYAGSPNGTAGTGNPAGLTGADAAVTITNGKLGQLENVGTMLLRAATINIGLVGTFQPTHRYGILVPINYSGTALATAVDETHFTVTEVVDEQEAA